MEPAVVYLEQLALFDYDSLDSETRIVVKQKTSEIKKLIRKTAQTVWEIGENLSEVKACLQHGQFESWLNTEFDWSARTAQRLLQVYERFKNDNLADLKISASAIYEMASPSTPDTVRVQALEAAKNGQEVTPIKIRELKAEAQAKLKGLAVGDYVKLYKGNTGKILESTGKSALVKHSDSERSESLPITPDYFLEILSIPEEAWYSGDEALGIYLGKAHGVEVYLICEDGQNVGVQCRTHGEFDVALLGNWSNDYPQILTDSDWWLLQAEKFLKEAYPEDEEEESEELKTDFKIPFDAWGEVDEVEKSLIWKQDYKSHRIYLKEINGIITRIQIKSPENKVWSCFGYKSFDESGGLNLKAFGEEWALDNSTFFIDALIESQPQPKEPKQYPHGHLKATPKATGDSVQKHPAWDKFGVGGIVEIDILGEKKTGRILAKENATATVEIDGLGIKISYSELTPWAEANNVHFSSESVEWYTPAEIIERVRKTLGEISLDPASCDEAQRLVNAMCYLTQKQNGLSGNWSGKVFLNPPYGKEIGKWIEKLVAEYEAKAISEAITLVPARTDTEWFQKLAPYTLCLVKGRLKFWNSQGEADNSASFPSAVVYLGKTNTKFVENFSELGGIWRRI
jgi:phage N-6-adenine-methyltransferase